MMPSVDVQSDDLWTALSDREFDKVLHLGHRLLTETGALDAIHVCGLALLELHQVEQGAEYTLASLRLSRGPEQWYINAGLSFLKVRRPELAQPVLEEGIARHPRSARLHQLLANAHSEREEWQAAFHHVAQALEIDPEFSDANLTKGYIHHVSGKHDRAMEVFREIAAADGADPEIIANNVAAVMVDDGNPLGALQYMTERCQEPKRSGAAVTLAILHLGAGNWREGWRLYHRRFDGDRPEAVPLAPTVKRLRAETLDDVRGKRVLMVHEQGLGDTIQFIRYARLLRPLAESLTFSVPPPLQRLARCVRTSRPCDVMSPTPDASVSFDVTVPMLDCPRMLGHNDVSDIPEDGPYFDIPDDILAQRTVPDRGKPRVGLCWSGSPRIGSARMHAIDRRRSIPFSLFGSLLAMSGKVDFVSLQYGDAARDHPSMAEMLDDDCDLLDTAAVISSLDLVITVDTAVAHLAGAVGVPVWLLSRFDGCWRWFWDGRQTSPWYPTMRIYRQDRPHSWPDVIRRVMMDLSAVLR